MLQTEFAVALLLRINGKAVLVSGELPCTLQVMEACTGECLGEAVSRQTYLPVLQALRPHFPIVVDCTTTDSHPGNLRWLRSLAHAFPERPQLCLPCFIHRISSAQGRSLAVLDRDVSGCISLALSMQPAGSVARLRSILADVIEEHMDVFLGAAEPSTARPDMVLKRQLWDTLLPDERPGSALRKEALGFWLNGTIAPRLQHFGRANKRHIAVAVAKAVLHCPLLLFPRHRWCTSLQTFCDAAVLFSIADGAVATQAITRWLGRELSYADKALRVTGP